MNYRFEILVQEATREEAELTYGKFEALVSQIEDGVWGGQFGEGEKKVGELVEIETCQLVGIKDGREVDLGDIPLSPEMKARELARQYGDPDNEDDVEASTALHCMRGLIEWLNKQGRLK